MIKRTYSLHKSRNILKTVYSWYKKKGSELSTIELERIENQLSSLDQAILENDRLKASNLAKDVEAFGAKHCKRSLFSYVLELFIALLFALIIATIVRQMWFEPYEIPTGSMRPTFRELDHLTVTKTAFGLNFPLETKHLYFDPQLVQRTSVLIFSGDGLPMNDVDTTYFGIFPYKKRYIKRLIGKPGDAIYFYGGTLYGVDKDGHDIEELRNAEWMKKLEYVPFLSFTGDIASSGSNSRLFRQMHNSIGQLNFKASGTSEGKIFDGKSWIKDDPMAQATPHNTIETYSDFYGIRNYAEARLLTKDELLAELPEYKNSDNEAVLFLQLHHTPSLSYPNPIQKNSYLWITGYNTVIPLHQKHLDSIMDNLYTARFVVANEKARRYSLEDSKSNLRNPSMPGVPDGTYEFYFGKATKIHFAGIPSEVDPASPLYSKSPENVARLFNLGIEMDTFVSPKNNSFHFPHRYAYFNDGDLYLMGAPILKKDDPVLISFNENERNKQNEASLKNPYVAFKDYGAPFKDGKIDLDFIRTFGINIPEGMYMVLGDNHAMSSDSRVFGFVPENNLQGAPSLIIWPPGERIGSPSQKPYPFMNIPRAIVWSTAGIIAMLWFLYQRRKNKKPIFVKRSH